MRNKSRTEPTTDRPFTPKKEPTKRKVQDTQAYSTIWKLFFVFIITCSMTGVIFRLMYTVIFDEYPDRKKVYTFTQFKIINKFMLVWPVLFAIAARLATQNERGKLQQYYTKIFRLNVAAQLVLVYICYYSIYYLTEVLKSMFGAEVMSGHLFTGFLSASSFLSITVFAHHFRSKSNQIHKMFEIICFIYILHMGYSFFWTCFVYHSVFDSLVGLILGCFCSFFIQCSDGICNFDINEPIYTLAARFMVGIIKTAMIESCELFLGFAGDLN